MKHAPRCEICAAPSRWWVVVDGYVFYCCRSCRDLFVHPRPEPSVLQDYDEAEAFYDKAQAEEKRLVREATDRARRLAARARRPRSFSNLAHDNLRRGFARYVYGRLPLSEPTVDRLLCWAHEHFHVLTKGTYGGPLL